jgi:hypothetical protein
VLWSGRLLTKMIRGSVDIKDLAGTLSLYSKKLAAKQVE